MKMVIFQLVGLLILSLPQVASAQEGGEEFRTSLQYSAKFICGEVSPEAGLGVVPGYYNTIINILATKDDTALAYRVTAVSTDFETNEGEPTEFSNRYDLDRDEAEGIICRDIKRLLDVAGNTGFVEGFVMIHTQKPLIVRNVLTGGGEGGLAVMQVRDVREQRAALRVRPGPDER